jgi:hypothetical protein
VRIKIGHDKFFNWHIYKNNCKDFVKEILKMVGKYNKSNRKFISCEVDINTFITTVIPTEFTKHIINTGINISNIFKKYLLDNILFYALLASTNPSITFLLNLSNILTLQHPHKICPHIIQNTTIISINISNLNLNEPT